MASKVEICNYALSNIRAQSINSLDDPNLQAQHCKLKYDLVLEFILRDAPWSFARKQIALPLLADDLFSWAFAYQYPSDCLKINTVMSEAERITTPEAGFAVRPDLYDDIIGGELPSVPYEVINSSNNRVIGSNDSNLWMDYTFKVTDPNLFDSHFILAFAWLLASEIAVPIIGGDNGRAERKNALGMYQQMMNSAIAHNADESDTVRIPESDLITERG